MIVDCNIYRRGVESALGIYKKPNQTPREAVANVTLSCGVPLIVACQYSLQFLHPGDQELIKMKESLMKFYSYSEVIPFT